MEIKVIAVDIPGDSGWSYSFRDFELDGVRNFILYLNSTETNYDLPQIKEEQVDIYKVLNCTPQTVSEEDKEALAAYEDEDSYPPCFKLSFTPQQYQQSCQVKVLLASTAIDWKISIPIDLPGICSHNCMHK